MNKKKKMNGFIIIKTENHAMIVQKLGQKFTPNYVRNVKIG